MAKKKKKGSAKGNPKDVNAGQKADMGHQHQGGNQPIKNKGRGNKGRLG